MVKSAEVTLVGTEKIGLIYSDTTSVMVFAASFAASTAACTSGILPLNFTVTNKGTGKVSALAGLFLCAAITDL